MCGGLRLLAEREEKMDRTRFVAAGAASTGELAGLLDQAGDAVGLIVGRHAGGAEDDLRVEATLEEELRGIVMSTRESGQKMGRRRLLTALSRHLFGCAADLDEARLAARDLGVIAGGPSD
jgi:hypothetical protein